MFKVEIDADKMINNLERDLEVKLEQGVAKATQYCLDYAKQICPYDTGYLSNNIYSEVNGLEGCIYTNVEYAPYVEYGTSKQKEQPFMHPSINDNVDIIKRIIEEELK